MCLETSLPKPGNNVDKDCGEGVTHQSLESTSQWKIFWTIYTEYVSKGSQETLYFKTILEYYKVQQELWVLFLYTGSWDAQSRNLLKV